MLYSNVLEPGKRKFRQSHALQNDQKPMRTWLASAAATSALTLCSSSFRTPNKNQISPPPFAWTVYTHPTPPWLWEPMRRCPPLCLQINGARFLKFPSKFHRHVLGPVSNQNDTSPQLPRGSHVKKTASHHKGQSPLARNYLVLQTKMVTGLPPEGLMLWHLAIPSPPKSSQLHHQDQLFLFPRNCRPDSCLQPGKGEVAAFLQHLGNGRRPTKTKEPHPALSLVFDKGFGNGWTCKSQRFPHLYDRHRLRVAIFG